MTKLLSLFGEAFSESAPDTAVFMDRIRMPFSQGRKSLTTHGINASREAR
jgi:hypothetical protein